MRIPIFVSRVPRTRPLADVAQPCARCQTTTTHGVVRRYVSVHVNLIPVAARTVDAVYTCTTCGTASPGKVPDGARGIPFHHRFVGLTLLVLLVAGGLGLLGYSQMETSRRHADYEAHEKARAEAEATSKTAVSAAASAETACFDALNAAMNAAIPKKVRDLEAVAPKDASALANAGVVTVQQVSGNEQIPMPTSKYFGETACAIAVPDDVTDYANDLTGREGVDPEKVLTQARDVVDQASSLAPPKVVAITDYACPEACIGVVAWISVPQKKVLAVVRVKKPMNHNGYQEDADELSPLIVKATAAW